jgi:hypothetical protein
MENPTAILVSSSFPQNPGYDFNQESRASQPLKIAGNFRPVRSNEEAASFSCESILLRLTRLPVACACKRRRFARHSCLTTLARRTFARMASSVGTRTLHTRPRRLMVLMMMYDESNCHHRRPWRALLGKAW